MNGPLEGPGKDSGEALVTQPQTITESSHKRWRRRAHHGHNESDFRAAFHAAQLPMAIVDPNGRVLTANRALGILLGAEPHRLTARPIAELAGLGLDGRVRSAYHEALQGRTDRMSCTRRLKHADGHTLWAEITVTPTARGGEALLSIADISERRDLQERLRHLQMHDPVTRLPNRTLFFERLAGALADSATGRTGLCYLDLDGFKAVNDTLGHRIGDSLLDAVAQRLTLCAEAGGEDGGGHLVARLGGDEFALLVESSTGTEQLTQLAQSVLTTLQRPFDLAGQRLSVSASIGVVERETAGTTPTELMQAADTTLYWAKADGKARWTLFDPERNAHRMTRQSLSSTLRRAVERGEFVLEYQPIVGFADDRLRGVEALVRWQHPQFGMLSPDRFIGLAEENGAIVPLGRWVLEESCRQARRWMREHAGPPLYVSVNVAVRQVWDSDLVRDVADILEETGLPAGLLQLELTESAVMGSAGRPLQALQALSETGVRIAIDDFGTGYSNLAYLSRLPVRALKLDGTFVRGFRTARHQNPADETIVTALVQLAHKLGLTVTAECVEGPAQAERLRRIGCDTGQGWHYAKPMAADRIAELLAWSPPEAGSA
ncbi:putative bifunctional diguanylate cyclase/phosphodiesterase [Streptomyces qinglanensis]|uniref:PAS domain S-box-containing protein/diguanylate cyclase (GGDEF) domain-containing protein n=1 Tax=Streptomyces qinglanensis TaxID=943816 RepID=A0A1H9UHD0_9ACTN|nr:PAS domain S-box-containing protein/diguanylate cyclase (GGDEF) domain-containing protein [Streptomyces qinglanensis]